jgi:CheY-like chemotaxis protein
MSVRILVVDDEALIAHNLKAFLEDEGMQVEVSDCAERAVALVSSGTPYDVCIVDLRLPGMDGGAAIQSMHRLRPRLRFIVHTGSAGYVLSEELRALGIADSQLFHKPISDMGLLADKVRELARI